MVPFRKARRAALCGIAAVPLLSGPITAATPSKPAPASHEVAGPSARISVEPLGFVPPGRFFMPYRIPAATLDFLDGNHLLFTFHVARLMHREPDEPKDDQDQTVRALVLSVPDGKIESEGTWRLHDRERYLWMLTDGHFLMRQRNTLYQGDKTLTLSVYLHPEGTLASVQLSPDASTLLVEYAKPAADDDENGRPSNAPTLGDDAPHLPEHSQQYSLMVIDTHGKVASRAGHLSRAVVLPLVEGGYLGLRQGKGKQWDVVMNPFHGDEHTITSIASTCQPTVQPLSQQTFLTRACQPFSADFLIDAFDLSGRKLWEQTWQSRFTWGTYAYSASGNRFAYGSVELDHSLAALDPVDESSILGQPVGVFSIESGKLDTVLDATPILTAGENFALSPNGDKLAILREGAIEIYNLPPVTAPTLSTAAAKSPDHP